MIRVKKLVKKLFSVLDRFPGGGTLVLAESLSAGLASALIASVPGASRYLWGALISYSNEAKQKLLGLCAELLREHGAVSHETVRQMALGALAVSSADVALSLSGEAGPDCQEEPKGRVYIGLADRKGRVESIELNLSGSRNAIRRKAALRSLEQLVIFCESAGLET